MDTERPEPLDYASLEPVLSRLAAARLNLSLSESGKLVLAPKERLTDPLRELVREHRDDLLTLCQERDAQQARQKARCQTAETGFASEEELAALAAEADQEQDEMRAVILAYLYDAALCGEVPCWQPGEIRGVSPCPVDPNPYIRFLFTYCKMLYRGYSIHWYAKGADAKACAAELEAVAWWFWPGAGNVCLAAELTEAIGALPVETLVVAELIGAGGNEHG
jgi:hypothetical protein